MNLFWNYISNLDNWHASGGITQRLSEHVVLALSALICAVAIALPLGIMIGHTRKGDDLPILFGALGRFVPPLGALTYFGLKFGTGNGPVFAVLVLMASAPIMSAGYRGIRLIDRSIIESGRAAGMLPGQLLREIEIPIAMADLILGVRRASVQVVAMTAVAAYAGSGGLGRLIVDGQSATVHDYGMVATGGVLLAALAVVLDLAVAAFGSGLVPIALTTDLGPSMAEVPVGSVLVPLQVKPDAVRH